MMRLLWLADLWWVPQILAEKGVSYPELRLNYTNLSLYDISTEGARATK